MNELVALEDLCATSHKEVADLEKERRELQEKVADLEREGREPQEGRELQEELDRPRRGPTSTAARLLSGCATRSVIASL
jgi:hypothetical protein